MKPAENRWNDFFALALTLTVGVGLATLPHWWTGESDWIADYDELSYYLPVGAQSYQGDLWPLHDPTTGKRSYYQPFPTLPGLLLARALGVGPWHIGLCWRLSGGLMVAAAWYLLLRLRFSPMFAGAVACVLLADPGVLNGQLGYTFLKKLLLPVSFGDFTGPPTAASLPQQRILNPLLVWPWWLAFLALTARAVSRPQLFRAIAAGVACGLLFHVYFYLWTTAVVGLSLAAIVDRTRWRIYLAVLVLGGLIGLPAIVSAARYRAEFGSDWLHRTDKFLPIGRFDELLIPRISVLLLVVSSWWVWRRAPECRWLAAMAAAALFLLNQSVITGLQVENFHWNYALGPALSLLVVLVVTDLLGRHWPLQGHKGWSRYAAVLIWSVTTLTVVSAGWLYARAASEVPETRKIRQALLAFYGVACDLPAANDGSVAGDPEFQYLACIGRGYRPLSGYSAVLSPISDDELDLRVALNAYLSGQSREAFLAEQAAWLQGNKWGHEARSEEARRFRLSARLQAWDDVALHANELIERFNVKVVARRPQAGPMSLDGWRHIIASPRWAVWMRVAPSIGSV